MCVHTCVSSSAVLSLGMPPLHHPHSSSHLTHTQICSPCIFMCTYICANNNRKMALKEAQEERNERRSISGYTLQCVSMLYNDCTSCTVNISSWCSPPGIQFEIRKIERARMQWKKKAQSIFLLSQNGFVCAVMARLSNSMLHSIKPIVCIKWATWSFFTIDNLL